MSETLQTVEDKITSPEPPAEGAPAENQENPPSDLPSDNNNKENPKITPTEAIKPNDCSVNENNQKFDTSLHSLKQEQDELGEYVDKFQKAQNVESDVDPNANKKTKLQTYVGEETKLKPKNKNLSMNDIDDNEDLGVKFRGYNAMKTNEQNNGKYKQLNKEEEEKFNKTYSRFSDEAMKRKKRIDKIKKRIADDERKNCYYQPKINKYSKELLSKNKDDFLTRQKKMSEQQKKREELLKKRIEEKMRNEIIYVGKGKNAKAIIKPKPTSNPQSVDINVTVNRMYEWEKKRKAKIEAGVKKKQAKEISGVKKNPQINKNSEKIAVRKNPRRNIEETIHRLYKEDSIRMKERKNLLKKIYTPSFKPHLDGDRPEKVERKKIKPNASSEFISVDMEAIWRGKVMGKMGKSGRMHTAMDIRARSTYGDNEEENNQYY